MKSLLVVKNCFYFLLGLGVPTWLGFLSKAFPEFSSLAYLLYFLLFIGLLMYVIFDVAKLKKLNADRLHFVLSIIIGLVGALLLILLFVYGIGMVV